MLPPKALAHPWAWTLRQRLRPPALPRSAHLLAAAVIEPSGAAHSLAPSGTGQTELTSTGLGSTMSATVSTCLKT